jgi:hypothetical protein
MTIKKAFAVFLVTILLIIGTAFSQKADAATYWQNGVLYSNVCRSGGTVFYFANQWYPVGSPCWFNLNGWHYNGIMSEF